MEVLFNVNGFYGSCHAIIIAFVTQMSSYKSWRKLILRFSRLLALFYVSVILYVAFYLILGNSLLLFFSSILPPTVAAWLGVRGSLRLGEMCSDPNSVAWQTITCGVSTNIAGVCLKSRVHLCAKRHTCPPPALSWRLRPVGRHRHRCAHSCPSRSLPAALTLCLSAVPVWVFYRLPHRAACKHHCLPGSGVAALGTRWKRRGLLGNSNKIKNSQASTFPVTD